MTQSKLKMQICDIDDFNCDNVETHKLSSFNVICSHCSALRMSNESPSLCCNDGRIDLPLKPIDDEMLEIIKKSDVKKHIRKYNQVLAFTSSLSNVDRSVAGQKGIYTFRVSGELHHCYGSLYPMESPKFLQIYLMDPEQQTNRRMEIMAQINTDTLRHFECRLRNINPYVQLFEQVGNLGRENEYEVQIHNLNGTYNSPTVNEVGAIATNINGEGRDIIIRGEDGTIKRISELHSSYDSLQYPLLFPYGSQGWHPNITLSRPTATRRLVSCREYYAYHLMKRMNTVNALHYGGRLLQQYVVDMYLKIDEERLRFQRNNQKKLRADSYRGIQEAIRAGENTTGRRILASSYVGGPRHLKGKYQDCMAMVAKYGPPTFFMTFTCNPAWSEILDAIEPNQTAQDRPDVVARVFRAKFASFMKDIKVNHVLGRCVATVYSIEFQKRGLPHAHVLVFLSKKDQARVRKNPDNYVCAEIPNQQSQRKLHDLVTKHMIHRPCDQVRCNCTKDTKNGLCKDRFPKPLCERTYVDEKGFTNYRRRNRYSAHRYYYGKQCLLTDRNVVSYTSYFILKYDCHINTEIASTLGLVKYLFKYVFKGPDKAIYSVKNQYDEIARYKEGRYVGPVEAVWRIFGFNLYYLSSTVTRLPIHLPNEQFIQFDDDSQLSDVLTRFKNSKLVDFFRMCRLHGNRLRDVRYIEIPELCYWDKNEWIFRKRERNIIGRMYHVSPMEGERYYLRLLLSIVRCPKGFEHLRTYNGVVYDSFKGAALARGLITSDVMHSKILEEAALHQMPGALRHTFAGMLLFNDINDPRALWSQFRISLTEDIERQYTNVTPQQIDSLAFYKINDVLALYGKHIADFISDAQILESFDNEDMDRVLFNLENVKNFTPEQKLVYDKVLMTIEGRSRQKTFFLNAPGGYGKTYLYNGLAASLINDGKNVISVASSGIASSLLINGNTAHSFFNIPLNAIEGSTCNISIRSDKAKEIRRASLIIWDETPMSSRFTLEAVDITLRDLMGCDEVNGGKIVLYGGDFRQTLPVMPEASRSEIVNGSFRYSYIWNEIEILGLNTNLRTIDLDWNESILKIGNGENPIDRNSMVIQSDGQNENYETIELPHQVKFCDSIRTLIDKVYVNLNQRYCESTMSRSRLNITTIAKYLSERAILCVTNKMVSEMNHFILNSIPGHGTTYISVDSIEEGGRINNTLSPEMLGLLNPNGVPPHHLILKPNIPVMLLRNINKKAGTYNYKFLIINIYVNDRIK